MNAYDIANESDSTSQRVKGIGEISASFWVVVDNSLLAAGYHNPAVYLA